MSVILNKTYFNLLGTFQSEPSIIEKVSGGSNLTSVIQGISPQPSDYNAQVTVTNEFGKNVGWLSATYVETEEVPSGTYEGETWNVWQYGLQQNVLAEVTRLSASKLYVQYRWREQDTTYIGAYSTSSTDATTISNELKVEYGDAEDEDWALVTDGNDDTFSWEYDVDTDSWASLGYEKPIYPNTYPSDVVEIPVSPTIVASESTLTNEELVIVIAWLTELGEDVSDLEDEMLLRMKTSEYDTEGTATKSVKYARNVGTDTGGSVSYAEVQQVVDWVDQDVTNGANVTFGEITSDIITSDVVDTNLVTVGSKEITENTTEETLDIKLNANVTLQLGQEQVQYVYNNTGVTITDGQVVYISGAQGQRPEIALAVNSDKTKAHNTIGVATEAIADGTSGFITLSGLVRNFDTSSFSDGDILYLGNTAGEVTNVQPTPPLYNVQVGYCVNGGSVGAGIILVATEKAHEISEAPDVYNETPSDGDLLKYDSANEYYKAYDIETDLDAITFVKTGWDIDTIQSNASISFTYPTFTLTISSDTHYYIDNIKYEITAGTYTTTITDTEGSWYVYFTGDSSTLTASQTVWNILAHDKALVAEMYWDATNNLNKYLAWEFHGYGMSPYDHYHGHFTDATTVVNGGAVSDSGSDTLNVTQVKLMDEDIIGQVIDSDSPSSKWEQPLTPLKAPKYYRTGSSGLIRSENDDTSPVYVSGGVVYRNEYTGSTWQLTAVANNRYTAYWVVYTTDVNYPVQIWVGQGDSGTLPDAIEDNGLASMNFGAIPFAEIRVAYRVIVQVDNSSPYFSIEQIDNFLTDPSTGTPANTPTSHGALQGLLEDDHTQYYNSTRLNAWKVSDVDPDLLTKVDKDLSNDTTYPPQTAGTVADDDLAFVYIYDDGVYQKMSLAEVYVGANTASGAFVDNGTYPELTSGYAYSQMIHQATVNTGSQVYIDIDTAQTNTLYTIQLPTISSTDDLELSVDNQVTYYDVLVGSQNINGDVVSGKRINVYFNGTNFIYLQQEILENQSLPYASNVGQYTVPFNDVVATINEDTSSQPDNVYGSPINTQLVSEPNFNTILEWSFYDNGGNINLTTSGGVGTFDVDTFRALTQEISLVDGASYYVKFRAKLDASDTFRIGWFTGTSVSIQETFNLTTEFAEYSAIITFDDAFDRIGLGRTGGTATECDIDYVQLQPTEFATVAEHEKYLDGRVMEQGLHWAGKAFELDNLLDNRNEFSNYSFSGTGDLPTIDNETTDVPIIKVVNDGTNTKFINTGFIPSANTLYTMFTWVVTNTGVNTGDFAIARTTTWTSEINLSPGVTGVRKDLVTSIASPDWHLPVYRADNNGSVVSLRQAIVEGDWTNYPFTDKEILDFIKYNDFGAKEFKGIRIKSTQKNLFDKTKANIDYRVDSSGNLTVVAGFFTSDYSPVVGGEDYTYNFGIGSATGGAWYDNNKNFISLVSGAIIGDNTVTAPTNARYARVVGTLANIDIAQLELGSTATDYEEYETDILHINGELLSDRDNLDYQTDKRDYNDAVKNKTGWIQNVTLTNTITYYVDLSSLGYKLDNDKDNISLVINGVYYPSVLSSEINTIDSQQCFISGGGNLQIRELKTNATSAVTFEAYLQANDVEFIYELETAIPRTLENNNVIDVDGQLLIGAKNTYEYSSNGVIGKFYATSSINTKAQVKANTGAIISANKEIVEVSGTLDTHIASSTAHASEDITYDNATSGLTATTVKGAIDEVASDLSYANSTLDTTGGISSPTTTRVNKVAIVYDVVTISFAWFEVSGATYTSGDLIATIPSDYRMGNSRTMFAYLEGESGVTTDSIKVLINTDGTIDFAETKVFGGAHGLVLNVTYIKS